MYADFDFHRLSFHLQSECLCKTFVVTSQNQPKAAKTTQNHQQNDPKLPTKPEKKVLFTVLRDVIVLDTAWQILYDSVDYVCIFLVDMKSFLV